MDGEHDSTRAILLSIFANMLSPPPATTMCQPTAAVTLPAGLCAWIDNAVTRYPKHVSLTLTEPHFFLLCSETGDEMKKTMQQR
jgi:hypothetical protein